MSIFKACDVRGRYGEDLTPEIARRLGLAVGTTLAGKRVLVGGDLRPSTAPLKEALVEGLLATGCRVVDVGVLPTPAFYFAQDEFGADGGVMVTGSHNPPGDNGFKISLGPWPITEEELAALERRMAEGAFAPGVGSYEERDILPRYVDSLLGRFAPVAPRKVVVDAGHGCYALLAPQALRELGHEVVELFCEPDGRFPGRPPNPAVVENLGALRETVTRAHADLGVAYDGDGDRAVFVDERGQMVESDVSIVLFARHLLRRWPGGEVIYDLKCSSVVPEEVRKAGGKPVMERSGHAFIKTALLKRKAILGGEVSGHFFFGELGRDDGLYATLLMLDLVAQEGRSLAELAATVPRYPITPDIRLPCPPHEAQAIIAELREAFEEDTGVEVTMLDGVRIAWADGWALARPSVTEPLLTLRFEAHTEARLSEIQRAVIACSPRLRKLGVPMAGTGR